MVKKLNILARIKTEPYEATMKSGPHFDPDAYAPVAERIRLFYEAHPRGRIITKLVRRTEREVLLRALVYRDIQESKAAATGWAVEREGDGDINLVACLENTETSAIGRALANLGFTASKQRPSAEEMVKASRARVRARLGSAQPKSRLDAACLDVMSLLESAGRAGLGARRLDSLRARVAVGALSLRSVERLESALRRWLLRRRA